MVKVIDTDVLVIGGGVAGTNAALKARTSGASVLILVKGILGRSGASIFAGNLGGTVSESNREELVKNKTIIEASARYYKHYLADQDYIVDGLLYRKLEFYPELEREGFYIRRRDDGSILTNTGPIKGMWAYKQGYSGVFVMDIRRKQVRKAGIPVMEETMVTRLLTNDGRVVGATALDYARGEFFAVRAKSTILATGNSNYLATRATGTREQCGNGYAMAWQAGAELQDLEIQWWHVSDFAAPKAWMRLHNYPNYLPGTSRQSQLVNSKNEVFFEGSMYPLARAPYYLQIKHLQKEVKKGLARWVGGYFTSYRHIEPEVMENEYHASFYKKLGINPTKDLIECGITWHMTLGGIRCNLPTMETNVPGLYAAGSGTGHYVGGIDFASLDGKMAGIHAAENAKKRSLSEFDMTQLHEEEKRIFKNLKNSPDNGISPVEVKRMIREIMWDEMGYVKNETKMRRALERLKEVREKIVPRMHLSTGTTVWNYEWVDALDVDDMLQVCELLVQSSIMRKESRGPFYREDYPYVDNENWLKHICLRQKNGKAEYYTVPVDLKYVRPDKMKEDFFAIDY